MEQENTHVEKKKKRSVEEIKSILDNLNVVDLYTNDLKTLSEIKEISGVNTTTITNYLKRKGVVLRKAIRRKELRDVYPIGTKFGLWTIISDEVKVGSNRALYQLCQCVCGNVQWKSLPALRSGNTTKCKKCGNKSYLTETGEININGMILSFYKHIIDGIKKRKKVSNLEFNITPEYLEILYEQQNRKCALSGLSLELDITKSATKQNWSLDRIDSNFGYIEGNVQWVHKDINMMKQSYDNEYFKKMCTYVAQNNKCS